MSDLKQQLWKSFLPAFFFASLFFWWGGGWGRGNGAFSVEEGLTLGVGVEEVEGMPCNYATKPMGWGWLGARGGRVGCSRGAGGH